MTDQTKFTSKLHGAHILIVGGTSGIGYSVAEACIEYGAATVVVSSSNESRVKSTVDRLKSAYPSLTSKGKTTVAGFACDLGNPETTESNIENLLKQTRSLLPSDTKLDHIISTAGDALATKALADVDIAFIQKAGQVRFFALLLLAKHALQHLNLNSKSSFTLTTGAVSEKPISGWTVIGSFAGGHHSMCRQLSLDLAPARVNLISPGAVNTELWGNAGMTAQAQEDMLKHVEAGSLTGKVAMPDEIAEAYLYVMRDTNITGSMISTNGGALWKR